MEFKWDEDKGRTNLAKHGVAFAFAQFVFRDEFRIEELDDLVGYGEERWKVVGSIQGHIYTVIYTMRGPRFRIISARRATKHEKQNYLQQDSA